MLCHFSTYIKVLIKISRDCDWMAKIFKISTNFVSKFLCFASTPSLTSRIKMPIILICSKWNRIDYNAQVPSMVDNVQIQQWSHQNKVFQLYIGFKQVLNNRVVFSLWLWTCNCKRHIISFSNDLSKFNFPVDVCPKTAYFEIVLQ